MTHCAVERITRVSRGDSDASPQPKAKVTQPTTSDPAHIRFPDSTPWGWFCKTWVTFTKTITFHRTQTLSNLSCAIYATMPYAAKTHHPFHDIQHVRLAERFSFISGQSACQDWNSRFFLYCVSTGMIRTNSAGFLCKTC